MLFILDVFQRTVMVFLNVSWTTVCSSSTVICPRSKEATKLRHNSVAINVDYFWHFTACMQHINTFKARYTQDSGCFKQFSFLLVFGLNPLYHRFCLVRIVLTFQQYSEPNPDKWGLNTHVLWRWNWIGICQFWFCFSWIN